MRPQKIDPISLNSFYRFSIDMNEWKRFFLTPWLEKFSFGITTQSIYMFFLFTEPNMWAWDLTITEEYVRMWFTSQTHQITKDLWGCPQLHTVYLIRLLNLYCFRQRRFQTKSEKDVEHPLPPIYLHWDFMKFWLSPVWNISLIFFLVWTGKKSQFEIPS